MSRTRTLTLLRDDIRYQADVQGFTVRHDNTNLNRLINESIQKYREDVSAEGITHFLTSTSSTLTSGVTSGYPFKILDLTAVSPSIVRVFGIHLKLADERWVPLRSVDFSECTNFQWADNSAGQVPEAFANITTYTFAILPAAGYDMTYRAWYLPVLADLSSDSDTFDGVAGWEQWVVWDVCLKIMVRDRYPEAYSFCTAERDRCWASIIKGSSRVNAAGGTLVRRDTMGRARAARYRNAWRA